MIVIATGRSLLPQIDHPVMKQRSHMMRLCAWDTIWREQLLPILQKARALTDERAAVV